MTKPKAIFARKEDGPLYVRVEAVMHILTAFADGISLCFFGNEKIPYMLATDAIVWCEEEKKHHSTEEYEMKIKGLKSALEQEGFAYP